jgi:DNA-directed RNA polymerase subunit M/transcription elongation factor TFIIS
MDPEAWKSRRCPACGTSEYQFKSRKKISGDGGKEAVETKYRCKECGKEWKERTG